MKANYDDEKLWKQLKSFGMECIPEVNVYIYIYEILPYIFLSMFSYSGVYVIQALPLFRDPRSHTTENDAVVEQEELQLI
jgi:hypothetical protein